MLAKYFLVAGETACRTTRNEIEDVAKYQFALHGNVVLGKSVTCADIRLQAKVRNSYIMKNNHYGPSILEINMLNT